MKHVDFRQDILLIKFEGINQLSVHHSQLNKLEPFPIAAIGASAGGLTAMMELLLNLSPNTGMAFIYLQHLDLAQDPVLPSLLQKNTSMKVLAVTDRLAVEPNTVYVAQPNSNITFGDGLLHVSQRPPKLQVHLPVNELFVSLAENLGAGAIGIVLSGNASDGTVGLKAIRQAAGITFAQNDTAEFQSMPRSAIADGFVDLVLSPSEMAKELNRIGNQKHVIGELPGTNKGDKNHELEISRDHSPVNEQKKDEFILPIIQLIKKIAGVDFSHYKITTIKRRIIRRMLLSKKESFADYFIYLSDRPAEVHSLYQDLLIHVTSFFRDADVIEYLNKKLLPKIFRSKPTDELIRIWVPACSTGEEAYSIAMVCIEIMGDKRASEIVQIFATDISQLSIAKARLGVYSAEELKNVSNRRKQQFFTRVDGSFRIAKPVRDLCVFAPHNVFKDPPFSKIDLISCRNLMIYLDSVLQKRLMATFHYSLNDNGYLTIGKAESATNASQLFALVEKSFKVFLKKKNAAIKTSFEINYSFNDRLKKSYVEKEDILDKTAPKEINVEKQVDDLLFSKYVPASVLVNLELEILHFRGSTGLFFEPSPGKASLNLLKMAREGIGFELRIAVQKANQTNTIVTKSGIKFKNLEVEHEVDIEVLPIYAAYSEERFFLIIFKEARKPGYLTNTSEKYAKDKVVKQLEDELSLIREDLKVIIEELESSNEELQSANEEIVSSNEELQSINEELETSREELESTNEELMTINSELQMRNDQLAEAHEYNESIYSTVIEALLLLDKNFKVRKANHSFYKMFGLSSDVTEGELIYDLNKLRWKIPKFKEILARLILKAKDYEGIEIVHVFPDIGERALLLNAKKIIQKTQQQELVLLTFQDVSERKKAQTVILEREAWLKSVSDNAPVMIWVADKDKKVTFLNKTWLEFTGKKLAEESGQGWTNEIHHDDYANTYKNFNESFDKRQEFSLEYRLRRYDGVFRWVMHVGKPIFINDQVFTGYIGSCSEIHEKKISYDDLAKKDRLRSLELNDIREQSSKS